MDESLHSPDNKRARMSFRICKVLNVTFISIQSPHRQKGL